MRVVHKRRLTAAQRDSLLDLARCSSRRHEAMCSSGSGVDAAESELHRLLAEAYRRLSSGRPLEAVTDRLARSWKEYAEENNRKVAAASKVKSGPRAGQSVVAHRWLGPDMVSAKVLHVQTMYREIIEEPGPMEPKAQHFKFKRVRQTCMLNVHSKQPKRLLVDGFASAAFPWLAVVRHADAAGRWRILHCISGWCLGSFRSSWAAKRCLERLAYLTPDGWLQTSSAIPHDRTLRSIVLPTMHAYRNLKKGDDDVATDLARVGR